MFCSSSWSKQVCYELTVEINCKFMSTIIVLIVSIKFEELIRKKIFVLKQLMMNIKNYIIQLMHSFEVNIRICQPENSDVHRGEAEVNITFEG